MYDSNGRGNFLNLCAFVLGWSSSSNLHKFPKNANIFDEENTDASGDLFRWSLDHEGISQGDTSGRDAVIKVRLCVKLLQETPDNRTGNHKRDNQPTKIAFVSFLEFLMVEQIFLSLQVKQNVIISNKRIYTSCLTSCWTTLGFGS